MLDIISFRKGKYITFFANITVGVKSYGQSISNPSVYEWN